MSYGVFIFCEGNGTFAFELDLWLNLVQQMKPFVQQLYKSIQSESMMNMLVVLRFIFHLTTLKARSLLPIAVAYTWTSVQGLEGIVKEKLQRSLHDGHEKPAARHLA